jgi:hypothetical protein
LSNKEKEKWIEDYVERETAEARKLVEGVEATIRQELEDTEAAENVRLMTLEPKKMYAGMGLAIRNSKSDLPSSDDGEDGEHEDTEEVAQDLLSKDDEHGWMKGTITKIVQLQIDMFWKQQRKLDESTQPG